MLTGTSLATYNLCGIVDPGQSLVGRHHGYQVGQGTDTVVGALSGVLLLLDCIGNYNYISLLFLF